MGGRESLHQALEGGGGAVVGPHVPLLYAKVGRDWGGGLRTFGFKPDLADVRLNVVCN